MSACAQDEDDDDEGEEDSDDDGDDEPMVPQKRGTPAKPAAQPGSAAKKAKLTPKASTPAPKTPAQATPGAKSPALTPGGSNWSAKEDAALKKAAEKHPDGTPSRWVAIATDVGGGKDKDSCKKRLRELKK